MIEKNNNQSSTRCSAFWNLPEVKAQQEIQKVNPFNSVADIAAFNEIKRLLSVSMGSTFAEEYMGAYED